MNTIEFYERVAVPSGNGDPTYETSQPGSIGFNDWDVNSLIDLIIKQYHCSTRENIVVIYDLAQQVFYRHSEKHPELAKLIEVLFLFFHDLLFHLKKEEQLLFPGIIQLTEKKGYEGSSNYSTLGQVKESALVMQNEHKDLVKNFEFLRHLTSDYQMPADGSVSFQLLFSKMTEFENDMLQHIRLENNFLLPKAIQMNENRRKSK